MIELSRYVFETLREDEVFAFCRGRRDDGELPNILLVAPVSEHPVLGILDGFSTNTRFGMSFAKAKLSLLMKALRIPLREHPNTQG